jgi:hypothetical protein
MQVKAAPGRGVCRLLTRSWQREAPRAWQRRLSSREDRSPSRSIMDRTTMPDEHDCGCTEKSTDAGRCSQRPASRRLTPIKAARETTNRIAARVKVGAATGEKSAVETSV